MQVDISPQAHLTTPNLKIIERKDIKNASVLYNTDTHLFEVYNPSVHVLEDSYMPNATKKCNSSANIMDVSEPERLNNCEKGNKEINDVCLHDAGDCKDIQNCTSLSSIDDQQFDPCPKYNLIGNGQCDKENYNFICSFDGGDCQTG